MWATQRFGNQFWDRYLAVFDELAVVARVEEIRAPASVDLEPIDPTALRIVALPPYVGVVGTARSVPQVTRTILRTLRADDALLMRVPSPIATILSLDSWRRRRPYGVEVVGDPHGVLSSGAYSHPLRPILQSAMTRQLSMQVRRASVVSYVTTGQLQRRYPPRAGTPQFSYSSIDLEPTFFKTSIPQPQEPLQTVITVASLEQPYKGVDVLIEAVARARDRGLQVTLKVVGDGRYRKDLESLSVNRGLTSHVRFLGMLSPLQVTAQLDEADVFVLASRTEGLPRAMIEAMARGLPCVGTSVGGIPELIPEDSRFPPDNPDAIADVLVALSASPERRSKMSEVGLRRAQDFSSPLLQQQRTAAYLALRNKTEEWLARG